MGVYGSFATDFNELGLTPLVQMSHGNKNGCKPVLSPDSGTAISG